MSQVQVRKELYVGSTMGNPDQWVPFEFEHPKYGKTACGEVNLIRTESSGSHSLIVCLWRGGRGMAGADPVTGDIKVYYDSQLGDETALVLEGSVKITNLETEDVHHFKTGDIFSYSKGTDLFWEIDGPFFKKLVVIPHSDPLPDWIQL